VQVTEIEAAATYDLRRRVLRGGRPDAEVAFSGDQLPGAFHLGVVDEGGSVLAVATFSPEATPYRPVARAVRLRGMAVEPSWAGRGLGRMLLEAATVRLRQDGVEVLWANVRDQTIGFYRRLGWEVLGESFVTETGIPHHVGLVDL
jgi:GNAT superfamily N-acetyltransferase